MIGDTWPLSLYNAVLAALEATQDEREPHDVPSASRIEDCRRLQWFEGKGIPRSDRIPARSLKKMASGVAVEPFWKEIYAKALARLGLQLVDAPPRVPIGPHMSGQADALICKEEVPVAILEVKDLGIWSYLDLLKDGLKVALPYYWYQVQSYMEGYHCPLAVFHAGMADSSAVTGTYRRRFGGDPPPFWTEVIGRDEDDIKWALNRAAEVRKSIDTLTYPADVPRDYDPFSTDFRMRCNWCGWRTACREA